MTAKLSRKRHIAKTITWRVIASTTTFFIAYLFFNDHEYAAEKATGVALAESLVKMIMYYFHERIWYKSHFGVTKDKKGDQ